MKTSSHHYATIMDPPSTDAPGHHYATIADSSSPSTAPHYESINDSGIYAKGKPVDLLQHKWYHGNISDEQVNKALGYTNNNVFLVRQSGSNLILSKRMFGWVSHDIIHHSPEGYRLEGKEKVFESVAEMIAHYQQFPITGDQILGSPADKQLQGMLAAHCINHSILSSTIIIMFFIVSLISRIETKGKKRSLKSVQIGQHVI